MNIEYEKSSLCRNLLSFGLSDRQLSSVLIEFERRSFSLDAAHFVGLLESFGHGRASSVSLLRQMGAQEKDLLQLFSSMGPAGAESRYGGEAIISLSEERSKTNSGIKVKRENKLGKRKAARVSARARRKNKG